MISKGVDGMPHPTSFDLVFFSNCDDGMPRPIFSYCVFIQREKITCHARRSPTMYVVQGGLWHAMPDIVRLGILSKGDDGMPRPTSSAQGL